MTTALEGGEWSAARPGRTLPPGKDRVPIVQAAGWAPGPVWTGGKSRPSGILFPDLPARSQSLYRLFVSSCLCLSLRRMELGSHLTDFHKTLYLSAFRKSAEKSNVSLNSDKNNVYFI